MLGGNIVAPQWSGQGLLYSLPGFEIFTFRGSARVTKTGAASFSILDDRDNPLLITASASDPAWIFGAAFSNPTVALAGTNGDVLKIGTGATDTGGYVGNSAAVSGGLLAVQDVISAIAPSAPVQLTANTTLLLALHNGANAAPGGLLALQASDARAYRRLPVRVMYAKRMRAPTLNEIDLSVAAQKLDTGSL